MEGFDVAVFSVVVLAGGCKSWLNERSPDWTDGMTIAWAAGFAERALASLD
jgi:hypothetical protein